MLSSLRFFKFDKEDTMVHKISQNKIDSKVKKPISNDTTLNLREFDRY